MSSWRKVLISLAVQYFGRVIGLAASLATVIVLTRALGVYGYGQYTTVFAIAGLVITFSDLGFFWSTIQHVKEGDPRTVTNEISGVRLAITLIVTILATAIVWLAHYPLVVKESFTILSIYILSSSLDNVMIAVHQSTYSMGWPTFSNLFSRILTLVLVLVGAWRGWGLFWFVAINGSTTVLNFLIDWFVLVRRYGLILPKWRGFEWAKYYRTVLMLGAVTIAQALYLQVDVIILSALRSPIDVGIYGAAQKVATIAITFQGMFLANIFPFIVEREKGTNAQFSDAISRALTILVLIGLPMVVLFLTIPTQLVDFIAGRQFIDTATLSVNGWAVSTPIVLGILGLYVFLAYFDGIFTTAMIALKRLKWLLVLNCIALLFNLVMNIWLDRHYSYLAAAILTVATELIIAVATIVKLNQLHPLRFPWGNLGKVLLASLVALAVMFLVPNYGIIWRLVLFGFVYILFLLAFLGSLRAQFGNFVASRTNS